MLSLPQPGQVSANIAAPQNYKDFKENALRLGLDGSCDARAIAVPHSAEEFDHLLLFIHPAR
jgi:hypothetical protein